MNPFKNTICDGVNGSDGFVLIDLKYSRLKSIMYYHLGFNQVYPDGEIMVDNSEETTDISRLFKTFVEIKEIYETIEEVNQRLSILREKYRVKTPQMPLVDGSIVLEYQDAFMIKKQVVYREIKRDAPVGSIRAGKKHIEKNSEEIPGAVA